MASTITPPELDEMLHGPKKEPVFLVDVREHSEYKREHIAEANLFPMSQFKAQEVLKAAGGVSRVCVHCASGGRSAKACAALTEAMKSSDKFKGMKLYDLGGGMSSWRMCGLPVVEDKKAPLPIIRQVHLIASTLIISGSLLTRFYNPNFFALPLFVGCGLFLSGATGFCGMALILQKLPYNQC